MMETLKFKVGDKVRVKSLKWYNENKNLDGDIFDKEGKKNGVFTKYMRSWCGDVIKINSATNNYYRANNGWLWYDWMLEDEAVTEEKQEQLNKNDMETKEMTKEEALEFLKDTKILCTSKAETIQVQVKLFQFGIEWISKIKGICEDKYLLFINKKQELQHCSDIEYWMEDVNKRIEPSEILAIQIKEEEKPKFDPKSLRPFDKVLVRDGAGYTWRCTLFSHIEKEDFICTSSYWKCCIPYNEETKHLVGTTEEAPEFYRI